MSVVGEDKVEREWTTGLESQDDLEVADHKAPSLDLIGDEHGDVSPRA